MKRYACFEGRIFKSEYWYYQLACLIVGIFSMCFGEIGFAVVAFWHWLPWLHAVANATLAWQVPLDFAPVRNWSKADKIYHGP